MPANTSPASAICGTHLGLTNADTSMTGSPAAVNRSTNAILSAVATSAASFCRPSRGPTSTTTTRRGTCTSGLLREADQRRSRLHELALAAEDVGDDPVSVRPDRQFHLHRLEDHQRVAAGDQISHRDADLPHRRRHRRRKRSRLRCAPPAAFALHFELIDATIVVHPAQITGGDGPGGPAGTTL